jgi:hypothetical protein
MAVTFSKNNVLSFYINGELKGAKTVTRSALNSSSQNIVVGLNRANSYHNASNIAQQRICLKEYFNDVRIYDHALSPKEVEELSKGLVLHYKLDDMSCEVTTNLSKIDTYSGVITSGKDVGSNFYIAKLTSEGTYTISVFIDNNTGTSAKYLK